MKICLTIIKYIKSFAGLRVQNQDVFSINIIKLKNVLNLKLRALESDDEASWYVWQCELLRSLTVVSWFLL